MSDDEQFGRNSPRASVTSGGGTLSEAEKARIRAEEKFRAQAKREAEQGVTPPPLSKKDRAAVEKAQKSAAALAALPPKERMPLSIVTALLIGVGILFALQGCGTTPTALNPAADMTPAQMLAIGDNREKNDPAIAVAFTRLDEACPENGMIVADIATTFEKLLESETGQDLPLISLMSQLSNTQKAAKGMLTCAETAATLVTFMGQSK
ncbi:hypothetical protein [Deinococcus sp. QL22]|uniref:hypothetical protein n=1 Tax=Deinococcus sp. QL22 TaxID=2939437 RepID=UPI0020181D08|nr:hypothetical protein [Deinococcus sp. QL22]UQN05450.1 hypothetical protein M1R55_11250 [Deinococcus sp. QL22]